jgi:ribosomal protein S18 acetylase RimI-like enzyme
VTEIPEVGSGMVARSLPESPPRHYWRVPPDRIPSFAMLDSSPATLRTARATDLAALLALEGQFPGDRLSPRALRRHLRNPRACLRLLLAERRPAGYALLLRRAGSDLARLYSIVVDAAQRGHGYGLRLLRDAERQARAGGATRLRLEVRCDNTAAIALYESRGFRRIGRIADYYEDGAPAWRYEVALA